MSIRWKLGILFLVISLVPLITFTMIGFNRAQHILKQEIGLEFKLIAREKATAVAATLNRRVEEAANLAKHPKLRAALVDANSPYTGKDDDISLREIERIDRAWIQSKGDIPVASNVFGGGLSAFLRDYQNRDPMEYGEIFITDRLGATVAMTSTLTDYYQADEGWWREGFADGKGATYIDDRGYDLSVNAVVTGVVVPVWVGGEVAGLLKINFKMAHIPAIISHPYEGEDVTVFMHRSNGIPVIDHSGGLHEAANETELRVMVEGMESGWTEDEHGIEPTIMGYALVQPEKDIYTRIQAKLSKKGVSGESWGKTDWYVFVERSRDRAYAPLTELITVFIVSGAAVTIFIIILSGAAAARVTNPLLTIRKRMKAIALGDLDFKIGGDRRDEIGEVLRDVDRMVEQLKKTTASRIELRQEVEQRKQAELSLEKNSAALERTNDVLTSAQRIAHLGNWNWNMKTGELLWSDEIYRIFGQEPQSFKANYDTFLEAIHPDDRQAVQAAVEKALRNEAPYDIDHRIVLPDGSIHFVHEQGEVLFDEAGEPLHMLGTVFDVTKRKQVEKALHDAKAEAEKANQAKSEFLASMSHELRTPLNAVLGFAQMLQLDPKTPLSPAQNEHVESILAGGNHLLELVNEVLDLARIEANQLDLSLEEVSANDAVADCVSLAISLGEPRDIAIIDRFSGGSILLLRTDRLRFKQSLLNLLSNAVKYNQDGGTVTVEGRETDDGFLHISVKDTGIGIAEDYKSNVFHMFHRLEADPHIAREGTGIGLTVTKLLVEQMAGQVGFESEAGVGSTFWIKLPLASNEDVLIWTDAMRIGVDAIDRDHQVIISLLNRVTHELIDDVGVDEVINELTEYARYHFRREEAIMEVCGDPNLEKHRGYHQRLEAQLNELANNWHKDRDPVYLHRLRDFLRDWVFNHVITVDTGISQYARGKDQDIREALESLK